MRKTLTDVFQAKKKRENKNASEEWKLRNMLYFCNDNAPRWPQRLIEREEGIMVFEERITEENTRNMETHTAGNLYHRLMNWHLRAIKNNSIPALRV